MNAEAQKGFTLIEFIIALAVAAVLLTFAVPTFSTVTMNKRITAQTNDFVSTLALARAEALKRVSRVTVCSSANGTACAGSGGWQQGWIVFADDDNDGTRDNGEDILRFRSALEGGNTLWGSSNVASYVSYVASGTTKLTSGALQAGTLALCDERGSGENARAITIHATGRARVESMGPVTCMP